MDRENSSDKNLVRFNSRGGAFRQLVDQTKTEGATSARTVIRTRVNEHVPFGEFHSVECTLTCPHTLFCGRYAENPLTNTLVRLRTRASSKVNSRHLFRRDHVSFSPSRLSFMPIVSQKTNCPIIIIIIVPFSFALIANVSPMFRRIFRFARLSPVRKKKFRISLLSRAFASFVWSEWKRAGNGREQ